MSDIDDLEKKIEAAQTKRKEKQKSGLSQKQRSGSHQGMQAGLELVVAIGLSTAIGYGLDQWLETAPLCLIIFFFLGIITGFYNVYRVLHNMDQTVGFSQLHHTQKDAKEADENNC